MVRKRIVRRACQKEYEGGVDMRGGVDVRGGVDMRDGVIT